MTQPVKDPDYIIKMKKRVRRRYARSFEEHPDSPTSANTRKDLRELALEEWKELEQMGYKIDPDKSMNPWGLKIVSPQKQ